MRLLVLRSSVGSEIWTGSRRVNSPVLSTSILYSVNSSSSADRSISEVSAVSQHYFSNLARGEFSYSPVAQRPAGAR